MYRQPTQPRVLPRRWYQRPVTWAFTGLLGLIVLITSFASISLQSIEQEFLQETLVKIENLRLLDEMVHHSRQRSVLLRDLLIADDPFDQDVIIQKHSALAAQYLSSRNKLEQQPLAKNERKVLDNIIYLNTGSYSLQQQIIEDATTERVAEAKVLMATKLGPNREKIYPDMMKMREMLVESSNTSSQSTILLMEHYQAILNWLLAVAIFTGIGIAWLAYRQDSRYNQRLLWQACHDPLTGLGNRYESESRLTALIEDALKRKSNNALLYLDIDQFNIVNNTSGQAAGDELLKQLAILLREAAGSECTICRVGSDQFVILYRDSDIDTLKSHARQLLALISNHRFEWSDKSYDVTASIGAVPVTKSSGDAESIWSDAYLACDMAKEKGGDRVEISLESSHETKLRRDGMDWTSRLRHAMNEDRLLLFSQGIKSMKNGMTHSEILVRYEDENGDIIPAAKFIQAAERYNLITEIDHYVVRKTLQFMGQDPAGHSYSINLSGMSLGNHELLDMIISEIDANGVDPERVCFEITETAAIRNHTAAVQFMNVLHGIGCHFFLDDFGSGLSSFGYLRTLPLDMIKIDAHFIQNIDNDAANRAIVEAIHTIAHGFGMSTIAEGVEDEKQLAVLSGLGIDFVQGYLFDRPARLMAA
ncbi:MAG: EAL domain-containing protein [Pseudomonadota bacterium]|nr:EAL domain-containing protein [Pseudomonadota bacterium]